MKTKAVFLLVTFLLNTVVGLGCTLRKGFHDDNLNKIEGNHHHDHNHEKTNAINTQALESSSLTVLTEKESCCHNEVFKFNNLDKINSGVEQFLLKVANFCLLTTNNGSFAYIYFLKFLPNYSSFFNREHPPSGTIRIFIQSFQI